MSDLAITHSEIWNETIIADTYFSENALLPGLVTNEFNEEYAAKRFHDELLAEMKEYPNDMPYPWLLAKFRQLNLDVYTHNFTLNYPLSQQKVTIMPLLRSKLSPDRFYIISFTPFTVHWTKHLQHSKGSSQRQYRSHNFERTLPIGKQRSPHHSSVDSATPRVRKVLSK